MAAAVRKVVVYEFMSLDGVGENIASLFDEWAPFWPGSDIEPFASFINMVAKYVATSAPLGHDWANAHAIDGGLVDFVRDLKSRPGGPG